MVNPLAGPVIVLIGLGFATVLSLLPAYPHSRKALVAWLVLLIACVALVALSLVRDATSRDVTWRAPVWYGAVNAILLVAVPLIASLVLWRLRLRRPQAIGAGVAVVLVFAISIAGWVARDWFAYSCIYFDYHHDDGVAWCPADWQATLGYGPNAK